jgi:hypothetical protein
MTHNTDLGQSRNLDVPLLGSILVIVMLLKKISPNCGVGALPISQHDKQQQWINSNSNSSSSRRSLFQQQEQQQ